MFQLLQWFRFQLLAKPNHMHKSTETKRFLNGNKGGLFVLICVLGKNTGSGRRRTHKPGLCSKPPLGLRSSKAGPNYLSINLKAVHVSNELEAILPSLDCDLLTSKILPLWEELTTGTREGGGKTVPGVQKVELGSIGYIKGRSLMELMDQRKACLTSSLMTLQWTMCLLQLFGKRRAINSPSHLCYTIFALHL